MLGSQQHSTPTRANKRRLAREAFARGFQPTPRSTPLSYPKPTGREPKGKVWDGASGHWVEGEGEGGEEGGDAKRAEKQ